ncbi:hypothetical protein B0H13DRAFT_2333469 [Mycena leptocephala]|nr:hypothetical protein B0H13DRAFT_2333469 [Mycena leptocephala]
MSRKLRWLSQIGRKPIQQIVKKLIPAWKDGRRGVQEDLVSAILDGDDILCCTATGDGKSAAFSAPILVLTEYNKNPALYPTGLPTRSNPVGIVVTPTKGLAANIVAREARNDASRQKRAAKRKAEAILDTTDDEESEEDTEGEDGSAFTFPETLAPPRSTRSRPRAKSMDSDARDVLDDVHTTVKRPRRVTARNHEDSETEPVFPASIPLPVRPTRSRRSNGRSQSTNAQRPALESVTNLKRPRPAPEPQKSLAVTLGEDSRQYKPRERRERG